MDASEQHDRHGLLPSQAEDYESTLVHALSFFSGLISIVNSSATEKIQTPFVLFDPSRIKSNIDSLREIKKPSSAALNVNFAVKALYVPELLALMDESVDGFDVQSMRETELLPVNASVSMHSPLLRERDVFDDRIDAITINSLNQVALIKKAKKTREFYGIRIRASDCIKGRFINRDDKFGIDIKDLIESYRDIQEFSRNAVYIHCHSLSRVTLRTEIYPCLDSISTDFARFQECTGLDIRSVNLGGGYDGAFEARRHGGEIKDVVAAQVEILHRRFPAISKFTIEPGRYLVEDSCIGVATVNDVISRDNLTHVIVDIATSFLITVPLARFVCIPCEIKKSVYGHRKIVISDGTCSPRGRIAEFFTDLDFSIGGRVMLFNIGAYTFSLAGTFFSRIPDTYVVMNSTAITPIASIHCRGGG